MPTTKFEAFLIKWYFGISMLASVVVIKAVAFPEWPKAKPLDKAHVTESLKKSGLMPFKNNVLPGIRNYEYASSPTLVFSSTNGFELRLIRAQVRQRLNLNLTFITSQESNLKVVRPIEYGDTPNSIKGSIMNNPTIQTCYVEGSGFPNGFSTHADKLTKLVDHRSDGILSVIQRIIGLKPNRTYECILVTLTSKKGEPINLYQWHKILKIISEDHELFTYNDSYTSNLSSLLTPLSLTTTYVE